MNGGDPAMPRRRIEWMDGVRCLAMFWILFVHFIAVFTTNTNVRFPGTLGLLLFGISGKLMVAMFCVLSGYFASKPPQHSILSYALRRWLFFAVQILIIELVYYAASLLLPQGSYLSRQCLILSEPPSVVLPAILGDAFLLKAQVLQTYWCVDDFIFGGIVVMIGQKLVHDRPLLVRIAVCMLLFAASLALDRLWIGICMLGWLLRLLLEVRIPFKPVVLPALVLLLPWLIRRGECEPTYLMDGIACVIALLVAGNWPWLQRMLSVQPLPFWGARTFEMFLLHIPVYQVFESLLQVCGLHRPPTAGYVLLFVLALSLVLLATYGWRKMSERFFLPVLNRLCNKCTWF